MASWVDQPKIQMLCLILIYTLQVRQGILQTKVTQITPNTQTVPLQPHCHCTRTSWKWHRAYLTLDRSWKIQDNFVNGQKCPFLCIDDAYPSIHEVWIWSLAGQGVILTWVGMFRTTVLLVSTAYAKHLALKNVTRPWPLVLQCQA